MAAKKYSLGEETEQIEFKKSTGELKEGVISIAAILNKHGSGKLYFGVKNDGTVIGQETNDTTLRTVSQAIGNHLRPAVYPVITREQYGGRTVILVEFNGTQQPYLAYNVPRIRVADEDLVMEQPIYEKMMRKRDNISYAWESQRSKYMISDIDRNIFKSYLEKAKKAGRIGFENDDPAAVMIKLELSDEEWLLNAGAALFVDCGINELQMAKFASDERLTFTDIRRFTGSILDLADRAVQYVIDAMDWRVEFDGGLERKEIPEVPVDAIREAVINAFGHRLVESGQSVEVAIYRSFIEIYSPGRFPDGVTPEMFIKEIRKPIRRNPLITRTLYYSKDMESFATGLKRIQDACDEVGCRVVYYGDGYGFTVRFYRHCGEGWGEVVHSADKNAQPDDQPESVETRILEFCAIPKRAKEIQEMLGFKDRRTVRKYINQLIENGQLSMTIPETPNHPGQKYAAQA
ncbi:MAG: putative DNA binding domain-containing protein [Ruminococcus sp.]|nr:putative DNA binding domain-containing protein [Ruminococcus sp.]